MHAKFMILSSKYGLIVKNTLIDDYDKILNYEEIPDLARKVARALYDDFIEEVIWYYKSTDLGAVPYMLAMYMGAHFAGVKFTPMFVGGE